ncbi:hypothetical protein SORBI_3004G154800 [Sorghum bicolor]|uniref:Uncharacterized protein n=1 Tax=Sorghum bicolor TaxID=4558 RepID=A0A1Z5RMT8_SORBI|nr:hypothetical protein SORBI_3004G154800 [Sorghum bicolor]
MACCRALSLQLLPASAHSRPRINFHRRIRCCAAAGDQVEAPQDAVLKAISQVASSKGRIAQTTNVIMGGTVTDDTTDEWVVLDKKGQISQKVSAKGKYVSVKIGPIRVVSKEQVQAVYNAMRKDERMKFFL